MTDPGEPYDPPAYAYPEPRPAGEYPSIAADSDPGAGGGASRKRWMNGPVFGFAAALVLVIVGVGGYLGFNALNKQEPFLVTGTLQLNGDGSITTTDLPMGFGCAGIRGYGDIGPGSPVTVSDESGTLLAKGTIESSRGDKTSCVLTFKAFDVPAGAKFYKLEISHRGEMSYTEAEVKRGVDVSIGDITETGPTSNPPASTPQSPASAPPAPNRPQGPVPAKPAPAETVPAYSTACRSSFYDDEFGTSAVGSTVTSCEFAEVVRSAYVNQPRRGGTVVISAYSPVTNMTYRMTCRGNHVVACEGGNAAVVYLY
jgi:hypothetical protein